MPDVIAAIHLPLWSLAAAFCVLCLIPDAIGLVRRLVGVSERAGTGRRGSSTGQSAAGLMAETAGSTPAPGSGLPTRPSARSLTSTDDWARDGDWAA